MGIRQGLDREGYQRLWAARLADLEESGVTQKQWCEQNNIAYSTLKYWTLKANKAKKQRRENGDAKWLAARISNAAEISSGTYLNTGKITVNYNAFQIKIDEGVNPDTLYKVLQVVKEILGKGCYGRKRYIYHGRKSTCANLSTGSRR